MQNYTILQNAKYIYSYADEFNKLYKYRLITTFILQLIIPVFATFIPTAVVFFITSNYEPKTFIALMSLVIIVYAGINYINTYLSQKIDIESTFIRTNVFWKSLCNKSMQTGYENIESKDGREKMEKAIGALNSNWVGVELFMKRFPLYITSLFGLLIYSTYIFTINFGIVILLIGMTILNLLLNVYARNYEKKTEDEANKYRTKLRYYLEESRKLTNGKDIRIYKLENWFYKGIKFFTKKYSRMVLKQKTRYFMPTFSDSLFTIARDLLAYSILVSMIINGEINIIEFTFMIGIITGFTVWLNQFSDSLARLKEAKIGVNNYREYELLDDLKIEESKTDISKLMDEQLSIEFKNVTFTYPKAEKPTIKNLNFKIKPGEKLALVGINGAGKTTIVKLLSGLYRPCEGQILINDMSIEDISTEDLYELVSVIFQDVNIFGFSIAENISGVDEVETDYELVKKVLIKSGLAEKVYSLDKMEKTYLSQEIDDKGILLSGGQTQKLMLARALYKNAPILILDEPTAALDPLAEQELYMKYNDLTKKKTSLFISHRLSSTQFCDRIIYLEDGAIQEEGTHKELMNKKGKYAKMFEIQSQYYKENKEEQVKNEE